MLIPTWVVTLPELDKIGTNTVIVSLSVLLVEEATTVKTVCDVRPLIEKLTIPSVLDDTTWVEPKVKVYVVRLVWVSETVSVNGVLWQTALSEPRLVVSVILGVCPKTKEDERKTVINNSLNNKINLFSFN